MGKIYIVHRGYLMDQATQVVKPAFSVTYRRRKEDAEEIAKHLNELRTALLSAEFFATFFNALDDGTGWDQIKTAQATQPCMQHYFDEHQESQHHHPYMVSEHTLAAADELEIRRQITSLQDGKYELATCPVDYGRLTLAEDVSEKDVARRYKLTNDVDKERYYTYYVAADGTGKWMAEQKSGAGTWERIDV